MRDPVNFSVEWNSHITCSEADRCILYTVYIVYQCNTEKPEATEEECAVDSKCYYSSLDEEEYWGKAWFTDGKDGK